ncbi:MAG: exopolysaccharide biosynthesis polyprenyl glycosylphosphotransferase [Gemmatimonadetes bacterium]|nr:exopolysaccharide biosynthesis polyprenyl glycosylphosphotransferase [Gemmatimonadota bacterium]
MAVLLGLVVTGNYSAGNRRRRDLGQLFTASVLGVALPLWTVAFSRGFMVALWGYAPAVSAVWLALVADRLLLDRVVSITRGRTRGRARTIFVGPESEVSRAMETPLFSAGGEYLAVGFFDTADPESMRALGHEGQLSSFLAATGAEVVVVCGYLSDSQFEEVVDSAIASGCQVLSIPRAVQVAGVQPEFLWRDGQPIVQLTGPSLRGQQLVLKRVLDVMGSALGLLVLSPLLALIAVLVRIDSPGRVLFGQIRMGIHGTRFCCWKFRSMRTDAEQVLQADPALYRAYVENDFKLPGGYDPRLTSLGRFLRRSSLDELPQLLNVLLGQMSLVGPRPIVPDELIHYGHRASLFLSLKPGLTGAWAVLGRSRVGYPGRVDLELAYVREWTLWRDFLIILRTLPIVLSQHGAH